ncbi:MAG: type IV secretory system conjugative DNA transfer family protein [Rhodospirillaceae bacterium]|nr:type IV secretory system conjugative DNA transfer family protein [Rhodospirillales bacterium]
MIALLLPVVVVATIVGTGWLWQSVWDFYPLEAHSWVWVWNYVKAYKALPSFLLWGLYGAAGAIIGQLVLLMVIASRIGARTLHGAHGENTLHGSARWARLADIKDAGLWRATGVVVGGWRKLFRTKSLRDDGPEHVLCFAPPRSGKGTGLVIPTLLSWPESVVVHDIRGENYAKSAGWRAAQGQRILKFDPTTETGSIRFNPLSDVRFGTIHEVADAQNIALLIVDPDGKGLADFWQKSGFSWLCAAILYSLYKMRQDHDREASLHDVDMILTNPGEGIDSVLRNMIAFQATTPAATELIQASGQEMQDKAAQERSGVLSSSKVDLSLYRDPIIAANTAASDFSLTDLMHGDQAVSLYIIVPPSDIDRLRPLLRVLWNLLLRRLMKTFDASGNANYKRRLLIMFDEFTSVKKLEIFEQSMAYMGGYGIKAFLIVQDLTQLQTHYGEKNSIMGLCKVKIAYAPNEVSTAKVLSEMCGKTTIVQKKRTASKKALEVAGNVTDAVNSTQRALLEYDEVMKLKAAKKSRRDPNKIVKPGQMLTFVAGQPPILGIQPLYFFDKDLDARSRIPAPVGHDQAAPAPAPVVSDDKENTPELPAGAAGIADRLRAAAGTDTSPR